MSEPIAVPHLDLKLQVKNLRPELDAALARALDNCSFCLGPDVEAFEREFADFHEARHAVGFNSGTSALHVCMKLLDVGPGDEVIVPPFTFAATGWAVSYTGAKPVFVDIEPDTFCLDPEKLEAAITERTKAVMPVHLYGHPCDMDAIRAVCAKHDLPIVEDAAQAHAAKYKGKFVGTLGELGCFSFYPGKNLGACGEGGAMLTNDDAFAERARVLRNHGSRERYHHDEVGFNYRMEGIPAATLRVKLKRLDEWTEARRRIASRYAELLTGAELTLPAEAEGVQSAWHLYVIRHLRRDELAKHLEANQVGFGVFYPIPLHLQKCYAELGYQPGDLPVSERVANEVLSLPIFPELTDAQIERVAEVVNSFS